MRGAGKPVSRAVAGFIKPPREKKAEVPPEVTDAPVATPESRKAVYTKSWPILPPCRLHCASQLQALICRQRRRTKPRPHDWPWAHQSKRRADMNNVVTLPVEAQKWVCPECGNDNCEHSQPRTGRGMR